MRRRNYNYSIFIILGVILVIIIGSISLWQFLTIPGEAEKRFGPADENFSYNEKFTYAMELLNSGDDLLKPDDQPTDTVQLNISQGESIDDISSQLERSGLIRNADTFKLYLIYSGLDRSIQAGDHKISPGLDTIAIAKSLQNHITDEVKFNILAGWRLEEIAAVLPTSGININPDDFLSKTTTVEGLKLPATYADFKSFEGLLLPGSYTIKRQINIYTFLTQILQNFDQKVNNDIRAGFKQQGLSLEQGIVLASIVEREAMLDDEKPIIASVFINRLNNGMKLESDPTVQFAIGYDNNSKTWWKNPLTASDLLVDSPYNTYISQGLPPEPICNPGIKAIKAVAFPAETSYYFFRAKCDQSGGHEFSETYEEHVQKSCP